MAKDFLPTIIPSTYSLVFSIYGHSLLLDRISFLMIHDEGRWQR